MADNAKVEEYRRLYEEKSDDELLNIMAQWIPSSEMHVAAKQILHKRQLVAQQQASAESKAQHLESLNQERKLHGETQRVAWYAFWIGFLALAVAAISLAHDLFPKLFTKSQPSPPVVDRPKVPATEKVGTPAGNAPKATVLGNSKGEKSK